MRYAITHQTIYQYRQDVSVSHHLARLVPRTSQHQQCLESSLQIHPLPSVIEQHVDYFGNSSTFVALEIPHRELVLSATSRVETNPVPWPEPAATPPWEQVRSFCSQAWNPSARAASEFVFPSRLVPAVADFADYARESFVPSRPLLEGVLDLTHRIFSDFKFDPKATTVATPIEEVIKSRRGVCQDFAHFQIGCLRALGLPARYVSGYLETRPPPGKAKLIGSDASHAWVQVWCGPEGWIDVDPTNDLLPAARHITVAWGRDYNDVCPVRGVIVGGGGHQLLVAVDVLPLETD